MNSKTIQVSAFRHGPEGSRRVDETVCCEFALSIRLNGAELVTTLCTPADLEHLVLGILFSEGLIRQYEDIKSITVDTPNQTAEVETFATVEAPPSFKPLIATGGGKGKSFERKGLMPVTDTQTCLTAAQASRLMNLFLNASPTYITTRGVHSSALASPEKIMVFKDDIGRHNALDKVFGQCLVSGIDTGKHLVILSGRVSSEMLLKVALRRVPILLTKAVPTDTGIELAEKTGITLLRCSKEGAVTSYTHHWRINT
ncbi:MAG: formate dehydrogenase accessory sulfurtransferase FdhD [Dehalococcoidaceae bacterium]|nr:formate dehydrogenase accessory sulfurtransferase FdhD [Dehalococcoidaceae bacterium]